MLSHLNNFISKSLGIVKGILLGCMAATALVCSAQIKFIPNQGQWTAKAKFKADLVNGQLWLTDSGLLFSLWDADAAHQMHERSLEEMVLKRHAFYLHFKGGNFSDIQKVGAVYDEYYNYFIGSDKSKWKSGVAAWPELLVKNLYAGVDLRLFSKDGNLKYELLCNKASGIANICMQYIGAEVVQADNRKINLHTSITDFFDAMPAVFGTNAGISTPIDAKYVITGNEIRFVLSPGQAENYTQIVIDPVLVFSTYSGSTADNFGCTGTYDDLGNGYAGGTVFNIGFPTSTGAFQTNFGGGDAEPLSYGGGRDAGILKFSKDGSKLLYCTYLGGTKNEQPHSMVISGAGELYVMGSTRSINFPTTSGAYSRNNRGDYDFFICKLSTDGKTLIASTYFGGSGIDAVGADRQNNSIDIYPLLYNYADEFRGEIITDGNNVFVGGITYSIDFPRSANSGWFGGQEDAVLFSLSGDLSSLNWSQDVGSTGHDAIYGITLGKNKDIYASGGTASTDLPSRLSVFSNNYLGGIADAMALRFDINTGKLLNAKHFGTNQYEQSYFVQTDNAGNPYFYGQTEGIIPQLNAPFYQSGTGQFIIRFDSLLGNINLSTSFGANGNRPNISPSAFLVDQCERIFISGWGGDVNANLQDRNTGFEKQHRNRGNTRNLRTTTDAQQPNTDGSDFYLAVFAKGMNSLQYATFFGGISITNSNPPRYAEEHVDGGTSRFDKKGIIYQAVCAGCGKNGLFPTTPGAWSRTNNSSNCNNALFKIDFENLNKKPSMPDTFLEVMATDLIGLQMQAKDPDPLDSVRLSWKWIKSKNTSNNAFIQQGIGLGSALFSLSWVTSCSDFWQDTYTLQVMIVDHGCPKSDTSYAYIRIKILEPPAVTPPSAICVSFDRATQDLKISWPASTPDTRFFKFYILKRVNPGGVLISIDTIKNILAGNFIDRTVNNPALNNYCYYLEGYNTCNVMRAAATPFCTVTELNIPITGVEVKYATVEMDKRVKIAWQQSAEPDFKEFELYKFIRGATPGNTPLAFTTDSFYTDSALNVDQDAYCYVIKVSDYCGHASEYSNPGCNVIITGNATGRPQYFFDLNWTDYLGWTYGVHDWNLERQYSNKPFLLLANTAKNQFYRDSKLDYDWGGYWYRVNATENLKGQNRAPYQSQSNWIYLYQPPEVYVPSGITADGNGLNDTWGTVPVFVKNYNMRVYNRWGQKVWESNNKYRQWDGKVNGKLAEDGVWAWHVVFDGWDGKTYKMTGTVTVIH